MSLPAYSLGRRVEFDEASRNFPIRALIPTAAKPRSYTWRCDAQLDQDGIGACVGFAWAAELAARPVVVNGIENQLGFDIYHDAQKLDEWPGEAYEGSSVLGGAKAVMDRGFLEQYRWAFGLEDLVLAIGYKGPAVIGINWYGDMFLPDHNGVIHPTGGSPGGHAILANGVSIAKKLIRLHNSWGQAWGINGDCFISFDDLDKLLHEQGEACIPIRRLKT